MEDYHQVWIFWRFFALLATFWLFGELFGSFWSSPLTWMCKTSQSKGNCDSFRQTHGSLPPGIKIWQFLKNLVFLVLFCHFACFGHFLAASDIVYCPKGANHLKAKATMIHFRRAHGRLPPGMNFLAFFTLLATFWLFSKLFGSFWWNFLIFS